MKAEQRGFSTAEAAVILVWLVIVVGGGIGWVWNIIKLVNMDFATITGMAIARIIGIFLVPLGAVLGYC